MSYQKVMQPHFFYENPEYFDEAESFIDTVSYSESDGFIGFPMVRSVPSYDIQELYIKKPVVTSSHILPIAQRSRRYFNGQHDHYPEYVCELKPRPPPHLKSKQEFNCSHSSSRFSPKPLASNKHRNSCIGNQPLGYKPKNNGIFYKSSPSISVRPKISESEDIAEEYPSVQQTRSGRPSTPMPKRNIPCFSESSAPLQSRNNQDPYGTQKPREFGRSQENELALDHRTNISECKNHPVFFAEEELKKPNSEGDATGYSNINELDNISRIAATLDVDESGRLSEKRRTEIKEMSKFLIPRVPSSIRSLQEYAETKQSGTNGERVDKITENKEEFRLSFRKSLDSVLNQLENCETSLNAVKSKFSGNKSGHAENSSTMKKDATDDIFNLREIQSRLHRAVEENECKKEDHALKSDDKPNEDSTIMIGEGSPDCDCRAASREVIDGRSAVDLHRSKSYIVNLIDRALSKELGTYTNDNNEEFQDLDPMEVIRRIEKNRRRVNSDVITGNSADKQECELSSSYAKAEDPKYIEQLKELRWGHFKHIQQEVKRLEDLERFLDHCGYSDQNST